VVPVPNALCQRDGELDVLANTDDCQVLSKRAAALFPHCVLKQARYIHYVGQKLSMQGLEVRARQERIVPLEQENRILKRDNEAQGTTIIKQ
jgi:hypothetical protein